MVNSRHRYSEIALSILTRSHENLIAFNKNINQALKQKQDVFQNRDATHVKYGCVHSWYDTMPRSFHLTFRIAKLS